MTQCGNVLIKMIRDDVIWNMVECSGISDVIMTYVSCDGSGIMTKVVVMARVWVI